MPSSRSLLPALSLIATSSAWGVISLNSTTGWTSIQYNTPTDYLTDQQTGQGESDLVGQPGYSAFYKAYDDGGTANDLSDDSIGFRIRVQSDENPSGFTKYAFIGIDADNDGSIDVFVGGRESEINFYSPGTGLNTSPSTTTVADLTSANTYMGQSVDWTDIGTTSFLTVSTVDPSLNLTDPAPFASLDVNDPANADSVTPDSPNSTTADLDGGGAEDYFFSFQVDMATLVKAVYVSTELNPNKTAFEPDLMSAMTFMAATSTQDNAFNQDLNGQDGDALNYNNQGKDTTWVALGAASDPYTASGAEPVPEPSSFALIFGLAGLGFAAIRRRK